MQRGVIYNKLDCLDVLETLQDNTFSLIYLDIPERMGVRSQRITYDESRKNPIAALCREKGCKIRDLKTGEIQEFIKECETDRDREYEKYLFKIVQNCCRVLTHDGVIVYRQNVGVYSHDKMRDILDIFFGKIGIRVVEPVSIIACRTGFDMVHFYSNRRETNMPPLYVLQPEDRYPYEDERGKYRLVSIESLRGQDNYFEWNGFWPKEGKGWRHSKEILDELYRNGDIVVSGNVLKLKYYREEHPVPASPIWSEKNVLERAFELFTKKNDRVLGIYESFRFAYFAKKNGLVWHSVLPKDTNKEWFHGQRELDGEFLLVDSLRLHEVKDYEINMMMPTDIKKQKEELYKNISKRYTSEEKEVKNIGTTTDEILTYYIYEYISKKGISDDRFEKITGVTRQTVSNMRTQARKKGTKAICRKKDTIVKVAVYTQMPYEDTLRAMNASRVDFCATDPVDAAIVEWLCGDDKDVETLNGLIAARCEMMGQSKDEYTKILFTPPNLSKKKKIIFSR